MTVFRRVGLGYTEAYKIDEKGNGRRMSNSDVKVEQSTTLFNATTLFNEI